jgi:acid phosphatase type 7
MAEALIRRTRSIWPGLIVLLLFTSDVALTRGPYLQSITATSAIIVWRTNLPGSSRVDFGIGNYTRSIELADPATEHAITLTDLMTGTETLYRVSTDGVELASGSFRTASAPDQPFSFAVVGDSGIGSAAQYAVADRMVALDPHFVLHTGDVIYPDGQADGFDPFFFQPYQTLARRAPIFPSLGNHDYHTQRGQPYLDAFYLPHNNSADTERYYSFDWGNAHFTALDFNTGPDPEQLEWLKNDLASTDKPWKFVFYHQAIYSSGPHGYELWVGAKRELLAPIFEQHDVDVVFNGHDHDYERTQPINDVVYIVSGGGGASVYLVVPQSFSAYAETTHHTVSVTIDGCTLTLQAVKPDGTVFDTTTLTKECLVPTATPPPGIEFDGQIFLPIIWKKQ